jgi:hypothetical protein
VPSVTLALLHSPLTSASAWGELPDELRRRGHRVVVPEVLDDDHPPYASRYVARASLQLADDAASERLILIGHSGAGPLLPQIGFARHSAGAPVAGYVFFDAMLPRVPQATTRLEIMGLEDRQFATSLEEQLRAGQRFPDWSSADLEQVIPDTGHRAVLLAGLRPRGVDFFAEPLPMPEDWPDARCAYVQLSPAYDVPAATAAQRGWAVRRLNLHHFAALTHDQEVADALSELLATL